MQNVFKEMLIIVGVFLFVIGLEVVWVVTSDVILRHQFALGFFFLSSNIVVGCLLREIVKAKNKAFLLESLPDNLHDEYAVVFAKAAIDTWYPYDAKMKRLIAHICASAIASQKILETLVLIYQPIDTAIADIFRSRLVNYFKLSLEGFLNGFEGKRADITQSPNNELLYDFLRRVDAVVVIYGSKSYDVCENIGMDAVLYLKESTCDLEGFNELAQVAFDELHIMQNLLMDSHQLSAFLKGVKNQLADCAS